MHLEVCKWFACVQIVPMLSLGMLSFSRHMVKWLDVMQAVAVSVAIIYNQQTELACSPCADWPPHAPSYIGTELPRHPKQCGGADVLPLAAADWQEIARRAVAGPLPAICRQKAMPLSCLFKRLWHNTSCIDCTSWDAG